MALSVVEGKVWKFGNDISTDYLMPGFSHNATTAEEKASFCMRAIRPEFAKEVQPGDVIVGGKNFGCGSSRVVAANLITLKVSCVIAESFGRIFFRNSINMGFPVLICPGISNAFEESDRIRANFTTGEVENLTNGKMLKAEPLPEVAANILAVGGIVVLLKQEYGKRK